MPYKKLDFPDIEERMLNILKAYKIKQGSGKLEDYEAGKRLIPYWLQASCYEKAVKVVKDYVNV